MGFLSLLCEFNKTRGKNWLNDLKTHLFNGWGSFTELPEEYIKNNSDYISLPSQLPHVQPTEHLRTVSNTKKMMACLSSPETRRLFTPGFSVHLGWSNHKWAHTVICMFTPDIRLHLYMSYMQKDTYIAVPNRHNAFYSQKNNFMVNSCRIYDKTQIIKNSP